MYRLFIISEQNYENDVHTCNYYNLLSIWNMPYFKKMNQISSLATTFGYIYAKFWSIFSKFRQESLQCTKQRKIINKPTCRGLTLTVLKSDGKRIK